MSYERKKQSTPAGTNLRPNRPIVGINMLQEHAEVEVKPLNHANLLKAIPNYQAIVVRSATKVMAEVIEHGLNLRDNYPIRRQ